MMKYCIAGNWKMNCTNGQTAVLCDEITALLAKTPLKQTELLVFPPFTALATAAKTLQKSKIFLGAQDCHIEKNGAYTGCISAEMLQDIGCNFVIVGHSERRTFERETNALVFEKAQAASAAGLTPIICVGETLDERETGQTLSVVRQQILGSVPPESPVIIAYEPVWAIGTGHVPSMAQVAEVHLEIYTVLTEIGGKAANAKILYGGSVKPDNAAALLHIPHVDGALVGGASLNAASFFAIAIAADCL